ncbi:hypothetical protein F4779DRAFT_568858 [Xylariaceae sp. FL0662B]|nr:hypothetical protein F4779DRAFT_568858 [Xylariaceae sp. FL0662B]
MWPCLVSNFVWLKFAGSSLSTAETYNLQVEMKFPIAELKRVMANPRSGNYIAGGRSFGCKVGQKYTNGHK